MSITQIYEEMTFEMLKEEYDKVNTIKYIWSEIEPEIFIHCSRSMLNNIKLAIENSRIMRIVARIVAKNYFN